MPHRILVENVLSFTFSSHVLVARKIRVSLVLLRSKPTEPLRNPQRPRRPERGLFPLAENTPLAGAESWLCGVKSNRTCRTGSRVPLEGKINSFSPVFASEVTGHWPAALTPMQTRMWHFANLCRCTTTARCFVAPPAEKETA